MINELNEIIAWVRTFLLSLWPRLTCETVQRFCQSQSTSEITELLEGLVRRCEELGVAAPVMAVVDNCCHVRNAMTPVLALLRIVLDVYHFKRR